MNLQHSVPFDKKRAQRKVLLHPVIDYTRSKAREVLVACSMFDPAVFKMKDGVLMFTKAAYKNQVGKVWRMCILESMVTEVWSLCHQSLGGHRGLEGTLNKFLEGFLLLSARQNICFLNVGCDTCLTKEQSMPVRTSEHMPLLTRYVEKLYSDLVSMLETIRGN